MEIVISQVEIHFHDQDRASIFLETGATGFMGIYGELTLFAMFLIRVLSNQGSKDAEYIAPALFDLRSFLENPGLMPDAAQLITFPGFPGRKRLRCRVVIRESTFKYSFSCKGFGLFGRGLQGYSVEACFLLALYLADRRRNDDTYLGMLCRIAQLCARLFEARAITIFNHYKLGSSILGEALALLGEQLRREEQANQPVPSIGDVEKRLLDKLVSGVRFIKTRIDTLQEIDKRFAQRSLVAAAEIMEKICGVPWLHLREELMTSERILLAYKWILGQLIFTLFASDAEARISMAALVTRITDDDQAETNRLWWEFEECLREQNQRDDIRSQSARIVSHRILYAFGGREEAASLAVLCFVGPWDAMREDLRHYFS